MTGPPWLGGDDNIQSRLTWPGATSQKQRWSLELRYEGGQGLPAPYRRGVELGVVHVDFPVREPGEDLIERDAAFEASQRGAQAEVDAVCEGEVVADLTVDVERVTVRRKGPIVAVGRPVEEHHHAAGRHRLAVILHVPGNRAAGLHGWRLEAQDFLDGVGDQSPVLDQLPALVGMIAQDLATPADEP